VRGKFLRLFLFAMLLAFVVGSAGARLHASDAEIADSEQQPAIPAQGGLVATAADNRVFGMSETGRYIVQLADPAVPSYTGGIAGLEATSPQVTGTRRLDARSAAVQAYVAYLHQQQDVFITDMNRALDRSVEVVFRYDGAMNGLAVVASYEEAVQLSRLPGVKAVFGELLGELETDVGPWFLGAPSIWDGDTGSGLDTMGEGVIVGIIDTGINFEHLSFAATDGLGYTHTNPYGAGNYNGWCATNPGDCNDKLIGAYGLNPLGGNPADDDGHGSHTGSTAAGNYHDAEFTVGGENYVRTVAGMAPRANVVAYKVCTSGCPQAASIQAVNHAIMDDMVDVLNYSISGVDNPWLDGVDLAFLEGFNAGIYIAASAGNAGPGPSTVAKTGPWNASTAASTINRIIAHTVDVTGPTTPPELQDMAAVPGENTAIATDITGEVRFNGANPRGCNPGHPAGFFTGAIALVERGDCTFAEKVTNAVAAGATQVIVYNHVGGPPITMGGLTGTPAAVMLASGDGFALRDYVMANPGATVRINAETSLIFNDDWENVVAGFSSRGPSQFEMLAPTFIAPGVNTLAAGEAGPGHYYFSQGTSMSSPHAAGAGALLMALNPTWSPAEVRSALALTANPDGMVKDDGVTPADPFDIGSGLLDLDAAGRIGLVLDETYTNFVDANPALGGDPKTLNLPAFVNKNCTEECSWTRTVTSVAQDTVTYNAVADAPAGMIITIDPASFTIDPGETQELVITVDVAGSPVGSFAFADIRLVPQGATAAAPMVELLNESFTDTGFPPTGWNTYKLQGTGTGRDWQRSTGTPNTAPAAAYRPYSFVADGFQDDWLVTPALTISLSEASLSFADRGQFPTYYDYSGVWISTDSCDPADGDFVELREVDDFLNFAWRDVPPIDMSAYSGETVCLAFRYSGLDAHSWWIDDVVVQESEPSDVATVHMPVAVIPALAVPVITVDPDELSATQEPDAITTQTLTIGNAGGVDLEWTIAEEPVAIRLGLTLDGSPNATLNQSPESTPMSFILDDGVGENAVGLQGGAQFLWFNRFTLNSYNFPITIDSVDVMFGYPGSTGGINVGELVDIYLYEDPDGNPANGATHRASLHNQAVQAVNGVTWSNYTLTTPVTFDGPGDILIAVVNRTAGVTPSTFPAVLDQTPPSHQRSWAGFGAVPGDPPVMPMPTFGIIDNFGIAGNWMVRGFGTGNVACDNPADVQWLDADPDMGTTGPGSTTDVTVTFDSTGLAIGEYNAFLCVESNDPATPLVVVPVMLEVEEPAELPEIEVSPESIDSTQPVDTQTVHPLTISNNGLGNLEWYTEEAQWPAGPVPAEVRSMAVGGDRANPTTASTAAAGAVMPTTAGIRSGSWSEGFDDITLLPGMGWAMINNSQPLGTTGWFQGNPAVFPAHSGATNSYIAANFNNTTGNNTISNWLLTPETVLNNGDEFTFWTRRTTSIYEDRLQVRLSTNGGSTDVGATATSVGDFTELLLDINPTYAPGGYPQVWTENTLTISGLSGPTNGRLAFRYFVESGGPSGTYSDYIGIDTVSYTSSVAPPSVLYDNGPFVTSFGVGPGGSDVSLLQNVSLGLTTLGASVNLSGGGPHFRIADEFMVTTPGGWTVDNLVFYAYQTGSTTTSSFTGVNYRIWDGPPDDPNSNVIYGDTTTNRFEATGWTGAYRFAENNLGNTQRPIMYVTGEAGVHLAPGTYWLDWQLAGTIASGPWQPPVTIIGQTVTGNAKQLISAGWQEFLDGTTGTGPAQGVPFQLWGMTVCDNPADASWLSVDPTSGTTAPGMTDPVTVTLNSTGLAPGDYTAYLCINSNDPSSPVVVVPVDLTVVAINYGVSLTVDEDELAGMPGETVMFDLRVTNMGNVDDTFELYYEDNEWDVELSTDMTGVLAPGEWSDVNAMVTIPAGAMMDDWDTVMVFAKSMGDPDNWDNAMLKTVTMAMYGVTLSPETDAQSGLPDQVVQYSLTLTNTGNTVDSFDITASGGAWVSHIPVTEIEDLEPGESETVQVSVLVPANAPAGAMDTMTVTATSQGDDTESASSTLTTTAVVDIPPPSYGVTLTPATDAKSGVPNATVVYHLELTNTGNTTDTFTLTAGGWATLPVSSFELAAGTSATVVVQVNIPANAPDGATNVATVTATSAGDSSKTATSVLTTTVQWYRIFMPLIMKP
jgi:uncharacterized membrane protein